MKDYNPPHRDSAFQAHTLPQLDAVNDVAARNGILTFYDEIGGGSTLAATDVLIRHMMQLPYGMYAASAANVAATANEGMVAAERGTS